MNKLPNTRYLKNDVNLDHEELKTYFSHNSYAVITCTGHVVFYKASTRCWHINTTPDKWKVISFDTDKGLEEFFSSLLVDLRDYNKLSDIAQLRSEDRHDRYYISVDRTKIEDTNSWDSYHIGPYSGRTLVTSIDDNYRFSSFDLVNDDLILPPSPPTLGNTEMNHAIYTPPAPVKPNLLDANKSALVSATKLEVGNIALGLITDQVTKVLPPPLQVLLTDSPLVKIAVANLVNVLIAQLNTSDPKILAVNESILTVAYMETLRSFNIESIISNVLSGIPSEKLDLITPKPSE